MDKEYLKSTMSDRDKLIFQYPGLIGRHAFYKEQKPYLNEILETTDKYRLHELGNHFIKARSTETASHFQRFNTPEGNEIHKKEEELYSMALDVALTYANK